jgi:hypothetical protein
MLSAICAVNAFMHPSVIAAPHRANDPSTSDLPPDALAKDVDDKTEPLQEDDDFPSLLMSDGLSETSSDAGSKHLLISARSAVVPPVKSFVGRKRKSTEPHRSVRMMPSSEMDAIQLNIYAPFRSNPSFLLYTTRTPPKVSGRWNRERSVSDVAAAPSPMSHLYSTSANLLSSSPLTQRPATAKRNFTPANRATKALPDFVVQGFAATEGDDWELDMSKYQDTKDAPPIQWKREFFSNCIAIVQTHSPVFCSWCPTPAHS